MFGQLYGETCMVNCMRKVFSQLYEEKWSLYEEKCLVNCMGKIVKSTVWGKVLSTVWVELLNQLYVQKCLVNCMHGEMAQVFLIKSFEYFFESSIYPQFVRRKCPGLFVIFLGAKSCFFFL